MHSRAKRVRVRVCIHFTRMNYWVRSIISDCVGTHRVTGAIAAVAKWKGKPVWFFLREINSQHEPETIYMYIIFYFS